MTVAAPEAAPAFDRFAIWGTSAVLGVTQPEHLRAARMLLDAELALVEQAASRFRAGTEILALNDAAGSGPVVVSPVLLDLVTCALTADAMTDGACDPTVGDALISMGYDRDFDAIHDVDPAIVARPAPGTSGIVVDRTASTVDLPEGVHLDLGATAKARAADRAAESIATALGCGVLVDLGGDLRTAGSPPSAGWQIGITTEARSGSTAAVDEVIAVTDEVAHHVIDPASGRPADRVWSMVTVAASTCVLANTLSTASLVWGEDALFELPQRSMAARLVRPDGSVERVGGWPEPIEQTEGR